MCNSSSFEQLGQFVLPAISLGIFWPCLTPASVSLSAQMSSKGKHSLVRWCSSFVFFLSQKKLPLVHLIFMIVWCTIHDTSVLLGKDGAIHVFFFSKDENLPLVCPTWFCASPCIGDMSSLLCLGLLLAVPILWYNLHEHLIGPCNQRSGKQLAHLHSHNSRR
jgi:hypothetical protein